MNHIIVTNGLVETKIFFWDWEKIYPLLELENNYPTNGHFSVKEKESFIRRLSIYINTTNTDLVDSIKKIIFVMSHREQCKVKYLTQKIRIKQLL